MTNPVTSSASNGDVVTYRANPRCLLTPLPDGTGVVLHLDDKFYFTLNATAVFVWQRLHDGAHSEASLAAAVTARFVVDDAVARADVHALLFELVDNGLAAREPETGG